VLSPIGYYVFIDVDRYPRREEVENANQNRMRKLSGQTMTFAAVDSGVQDLNVRKNLLANFIAPETLELKKGAQVMLIKNIDSQLVNGSLGIVQSFMDEGTFFTYKADEPTFLIAQDHGQDKEETAAAREKIQAARLKANATGSTRLWPMVRFNLADGTSRDVLCTPDDWKTEAQNGDIIAKRTQVPLILAWALSIHKAQGQTLSRVKVDLGKVFEKGQAYVALSRATSKQGLQVLRFDERKVMVHQKVLHFYSKLRGHETLEARKVTSTVVADPGKKSVSIVQKEVVKKHNAHQILDADDFDDDDLSYEDMLAAESEVLRATGRG
jgi:ATP-dependent DNA helicase PIF1